MTPRIAIVLAAATLLCGPALAQSPTAADASPLTIESGVKSLLADAKAKAIIARYAPTVVEFFESGQAEGMVPGEMPLVTLAENTMARDAGLTADNLKRISDELAQR